MGRGITVAVSIQSAELSAIASQMVCAISAAFGNAQLPRCNPGLINSSCRALQQLMFGQNNAYDF
jgi:hypothetical protein